MHVAFAHERFLFRFGHDRTMLLHGRALARRGHRVTYIAYRGDREAIERFGARLTLLPLAAPSYAELDSFGASYLREHWADIFADGAPDIIVNGGWPFYAATEVFEEQGVPSVYFDAGATPLEGLPPEELATHRQLRRLRRSYIGANAATVSVSQFIARSQTLVDAPSTPNTVVYNAVDHIEDPLWTASEAGGSGGVQGVLDRARAGGRKAILHLGRWEGGYKNKAGALDVLRKVVEHGVNASMVVLAEGDALVPQDLRSRLVFAGNPDDDGLRALMRGGDVGVSTSLWEGFNLPLAEMHYLARPAYVLDVGAHREVAIAAEFVCASIAEMVDRVAARLRGPGDDLPRSMVEPYRRRMQWSRVAAELEQVLVSVAPDVAPLPVKPAPVQAEGAAAEPKADARLLVIDVTNASRDPANSGVIRVTRRVVRELSTLVTVLPVVWDPALDDYRLPFDYEQECLSRFGGPSPEAPRSGAAKVSLSDHLARASLTHADVAMFYPETILDPRVRSITAWAARTGVDCSAILHDVIPLTHPEFCDSGIVEIFPEYVAFLKRARLLIPNSAFTAEQWRSVVAGGAGPALAVEPLPGDFGPRVFSQPPQDGPIRILTVSTLEPRKNHRSLLDAFEAVQRRTPPLKLELHLVGNGYEGANTVLAEVRARAANNPSIVYHGVVDDERLAELYAEAHFSVYPSLVEGFGLPVLESLWRRRPFICHQEGPMAETARGGGGLTCDVGRVDSLGRSLQQMASDAELRRTLSLAAGLRRVRTWRDYAQACLRHVLGPRGGMSIARKPDVAVAQAASPTPPVPAAGASVLVAPARETAPTGPRPVKRPEASADWDALLYPDKPVTRWQMSDAERMGLTGLLARWKPTVYMEIGVFYGGSTLLASEFADRVFSIDIDPEAVDRFNKPENVTFISGASHEVAPALLDSLSEEDLYPEVVLIDGDHSTEGVTRDIELFLQRRPAKPMLIVFHDSFNPAARAGIVGADWAGCPWAQRLEIDFVAGGMVDQESNPHRGEMWGGLAVALLTPTAREGDFYMSATAQGSYDRAVALAKAAA